MSNIKDMAVAVLYALCLLNVLGLMLGSFPPSPEIKKDCDEFNRPVEYLVPGYQLGCWLFAPFKGDENDRT
jgi:hypothetical protein